MPTVKSVGIFLFPKGSLILEVIKILQKKTFFVSVLYKLPNFDFGSNFD